MAVKTDDRVRRASDSYLALVSFYPIHPIRSDEDLAEAIAVLDSLLGRDEPLDSQERDYRDSLAHEIRRYEEESVPMPDVSGAEMLRYLMEGRDATLSQVSDATGIAISTLSSLLRGKRNFTVGHMKALAAHFGVPAEVFLD